MKLRNTVMSKKLPDCKVMFPPAKRVPDPGDFEVEQGEVRRCSHCGRDLFLTVRDGVPTWIEISIFEDDTPKNKSISETYDSEKFE